MENDTPPPWQEDPDDPPEKNSRDEGAEKKEEEPQPGGSLSKLKDVGDRTKSIVDWARKGRAASQAAEGATTAAEAAGAAVEGATAAGEAAGAAGSAATAGSAAAASGTAATGAAGGAAAAAGSAGGSAAAGGAAAGGVAIAPWVIVAIVVVVVIILIFFFFFKGTLSSGDDDTNQTATSQAPPAGNTDQTNKIPGLTLTLTGPISVNNGQDIEYMVSYTYDVSVGKIPVEKIILFDKIPDTARFVSTDGVQTTDSTSTLVSWSLEEPSNQKPFKLILHPTVENVYINNILAAKLAPGAGSGSGTGSATGDPPEFLALVVGQGRNTGVLGDKASFISTIISNSSGLPLTGKETYLGAIYDAGIQYGVNPLIIASIWGTESGFDTAATYPFGCLNPSDAGFTENVTCAAGSLNQLMGTFETHNTGGSLEIPSSIGNTCIYTDAFVYAYEMYAPICHVNDHNDPARGNFTRFYKKFKGI